VVPVWPGRYLVHVHSPYLMPTRVGPADFTVDVPPARVVELEYKAPVWAFSRGALGPGPQRYNGLAAMLGLTAALLLIMLAGVVTYLAFA
jgi:hypothetical protein